MAYRGPYPATFSGNTSAMVVSATTFDGSIINTGTIGAGGIAVISSTFLSGGIRDTGTISGGISVDSHSEIVASGANTAIAVESGGTFGGGITNAGILSAPSAAFLPARCRPFRAASVIPVRSYGAAVWHRDWRRSVLQRRGTPGQELCRQRRQYRHHLGRCRHPALR